MYTEFGGRVGQEREGEREREVGEIEERERRGKEGG